MTEKRNQSAATSQVRKRRRLQPAEQTNTTEAERDESHDRNNQPDSQSDPAAVSKVRVQSNVWKYAYRDHDTPGWAICKICPIFPNPKRLSIKEGSTSTLRKHLANVHNKTELESVAKMDRRQVVSLSPSERDRLHQLLIDAVVIGGRSFSDFRKPGLSRFLNEIVPGRVTAYEFMVLST
jgi:hypothetical protein